MLRRALILAVLLGTACLGAAAAHAQEATILPIVVNDPLYNDSYVYDVSDTGVAVGSYGLKWNKSRAFRWTEAQGLTVLPDIEDDDFFNATAYGISSDGKTIVGYAGWLDAVKWTDQGVEALDRTPALAQASAVSQDGSVIVGYSDFGPERCAWRRTSDSVQFLQPTAALPGSSSAWRVSGDGKYVVGHALAADGYYHPYRWSEEEGMRDLGIIGPGDFYARDITDDGSTVVGYGNLVDPERHLILVAFQWNEFEGITMLPDGLDTEAHSISGDGNIIVGGRDVWTDGEKRRFQDMLVFEYGVNLSGWDELNYLMNVGADGTRLVGSGKVGGVQRGFMTEYPAPPRVEGVLSSPVAAGVRGKAVAAPLPPVTNGAVVKAKVNEPIQIPFRAVDPGGDELQFFADIPPGATVTPAPGPVDDATFQGTLTWTPASADLRQVKNVHLYVRDVEGRRGSLRFKLLAVPAVPPTIEPILPVKIECRPGANRVKLQTTVGDPEGDELTVKWLVAGKVRKNHTVAAGSVVAFEFDYPHGESLVVVEVSDSFNVTTAQTTVTVQDTLDPIVVVAPQVKFPVERGELYSLSSRLQPPRVEDACDEAPKVSDNAPVRLPVGETVVTWTVEDASGNVAKARQSVVVVNEEPVARTGKNMRKTTTAKFASVRLDGSKSFDPDRHDLKYLWKVRGVRFDDPKSARPLGKFPPGTTQVTLTVTDEGGRKSTDTMTVFVRKTFAHRPSAAAARVTAANAYEGALAGSDPTSLAASREASAARVLGLYPDAEADEITGGRAAYEIVRARQRWHAQNAAALLYQSYLSGGNEQALFASAEAYRSVLHAQMDLAE